MTYNSNPPAESITALPELRKGISGSTLKLMAIITMLIDHTAATVLERLLTIKSTENLNSNDLNAANEFFAKNAWLYTLDIVMRLIGRLAFPIFCFLLVEGFVHTHNIRKYALRLALFALLSEIPFNLALYGKVLYPGSQNVFFTLFLGLLVLEGMKAISEKAEKWLPALATGGILGTAFLFAYLFRGLLQYLYEFLNTYESKYRIPDIGLPFLMIFFLFIIFILYAVMRKRTSSEAANRKFACLAVLAAGFLLAKLLRTDYSGFGVLTIAVMYLLRKNYVKAMFGGCLILTVMSMFEITSFFTLIPASLYNGKRGWNLKYIFYAFYPVHLLALYFICQFLGIIRS